jgi:hypothetical protein
MRSAVKIVLMIGLVALFQACIKTQTYPIVPEITYDNIVVTKDTDQLGNIIDVGRLSIEFTDGDGDIGLRKSDTTGPYHPDSLYYYNLLLDYYEWDGSGFVLTETATPYHGRVPYLTPEGKNKSISGLIYYDVNITYVPSDTFRFDVRLVDRALHVSNTVETPGIILYD